MWPNSTPYAMVNKGRAQPYCFASDLRAGGPRLRGDLPSSKTNDRVRRVPVVAEAEEQDDRARYEARNVVALPSGRGGSKLGKNHKPRGALRENLVEKRGDVRYKRVGEGDAPAKCALDPAPLSFAHEAVK